MTPHITIGVMFFVASTLAIFLRCLDHPDILTGKKGMALQALPDVTLAAAVYATLAHGAWISLMVDILVKRLLWTHISGLATHLIIRKTMNDVFKRLVRDKELEDGTMFIIEGREGEEATITQVDPDGTKTQLSGRAGDEGPKGTVQ